MNEIYKVYKTTECNRYGHVIWKVSNYGNVKRNDKLYECGLNGSGYKTFAGGEYLHKIVAKLFIPNPDNKPHVDHIDTDKLNNRVDNLQWVTPKENSNNPKTRQHLSESQKGKQQTEDTKQKISEANTGKTLTDETKEKMSEAKTGKNNPCYGKKLMNNGIIQKYIPKDEVEMYLEQGWKLGKLHK